MGDGATLLHLMWLASPALPVGGFSYSEGLESAVDAGIVTGESTAASWLIAHLRTNLSRAELPAVATAYQSWSRSDVCSARAINDWVRCTRESAELRLQTDQMGRSLVAWLRNGAHRADPRLAALGTLEPAPTWPVSFALAAVLAGADCSAALHAYAFSWAENLVQAACKVVPIGQAAAQRVLGQLVEAIPQACVDAVGTPMEAAQAFAPMLAILSSRHETQYSRLFRS